MFWLVPLWIGIFFNLLMTVANFVVPYHTSFGQWYFEKNGDLRIMLGGWGFFLGWTAYLIAKAAS